MANTWFRLGITQETVDQCKNLSMVESNGKSRDYWSASLNFLKHIEHSSYSDLTVSQRNWARNIVRDLKNKALQ